MSDLRIDGQDGLTDQTRPPLVGTWPHEQLLTHGTAPEMAAAPCGCRGYILDRRRGQYPFVSIRITVPCTGGHPGRVSAGVIERFPKVDSVPAPAWSVA